MLSPLRNRFGIPGVISVIALVFAMLGGAYAASNNDNGKATASAKAKKGPKGPKGAKGDTGPAGPQGPAGPAGAKGDKGDAGSNGANGTNGTGTPGTSATVTNEAPNPTGPCGIPGGIKVKSASPDAFVCNGTDGTPGNNGSPWAPENELPTDATLTGTWTIPIGSNVVTAAQAMLISFPIPLSAELDSDHVHYQDNADFADFCTGTAADPTAPSGHLCIYKTIVFNAVVTAPSFAGKTGTVMTAVATAGAAFVNGTWAVTG